MDAFWRFSHDCFATATLLLTHQILSALQYYKISRFSYSLPRNRLNFTCRFLDASYNVCVHMYIYIEAYLCVQIETVSPYSPLLALDPG